MSLVLPSEAKSFLHDLLLNRNAARDQIAQNKVDLRQLQIPNLKTPGTTSYRDIPVAKKLVKDKLVPLHDYGFTKKPSYYADEARTNPVYRQKFPAATPAVLMLKQLAERLAEANEILRRNLGLELEPMDGFRPLAVQRGILGCFYRAGLKKYEDRFNGEALQAKAMEYALTYASRPPEKVTLSDPRSWYAHGTGAAIDMMLKLTQGARLDFGVIFDDPDKQTHIRAMESSGTELTPSQRAFRENRRVLFWTMASAGFVNYPEEFSHFDPIRVPSSDGVEYTTQFAILNGRLWGVPGAAALRATVPVAKDALT